ncbi:TIGR04076 family protein [Clostridium baratii]|uniref:TIGR04076 family protein n=1 Tax=Clostridium baratii TaxID=1561 RepID=UPI0029033A55|nr:TIGR04076 family protein [Clostridium baratii]MDU1054408.1 TIGR04076 family protein [Clostridium baratii]
MKKVKIKVLKRNCYKELANKYGHDDNYSPCPVLKEDEEYVTTGIFGNDIPAGFCHMAWQALVMPVNVLIGGGKVLGFDDVHIACCTDGLRPVIFELKVVEEG